jgi:hypothetical protein
VSNLNWPFPRSGVIINRRPAIFDFPALGSQSIACIGLAELPNGIAAADAAIKKTRNFIDLARLHLIVVLVNAGLFALGAILA